MQKLKMMLPEGFINALYKRHHGANYTKKEIEDTYKRLSYLYKRYCKNRDRENWLLDIFWEEEKIESYFGERKWINAHKRLRRCRDNKKKFHQYMFATLTNFDGNSGQEFCQYSVISPDEIMEDFESKYLDNKK